MRPQLWLVVYNMVLKTLTQWQQSPRLQASRCRSLHCWALGFSTKRGAIPMIQHRCRQLRQHGEQPQRKGARTPITGICVTVESTPNYQYNTAWDTSMHAVAALSTANWVSHYKSAYSLSPLGAGHCAMYPLIAISSLHDLLLEWRTCQILNCLKVFLAITLCYSLGLSWGLVVFPGFQTHVGNEISATTLIQSVCSITLQAHGGAPSPGATFIFRLTLEWCP